MKSLSKLIKGDSKEGSPSRRDNRSWAVAIPVAAVLVGVGIFLSAVINPLFGRYVHWDWMAVLAPVLFIAAVAAVRRRSPPLNLTRPCRGHDRRVGLAAENQTPPF